jgi:hypothetical protein
MGENNIEFDNRVFSDRESKVDFPSICILQHKSYLHVKRSIITGGDGSYGTMT